MIMHMDDSADLAIIPVRTERLAMDWSLVLASQGIAATIYNDAETGWALLVPGMEHAQALDALAQYKRENARWPWQQSVTDGEVFDWASLLWLVLTCVFFRMQMMIAEVDQAGIVDSVAVRHGQWWRLFTAEVLHGDILHLATNGVFGVLLLGLAMGRFGTGVAMLAAILAGAVGNWFSLLMHPGPYRALGASGVVMAALGLLAASSIGAARYRPRGWKVAVGGIAVGIMLFAVLGVHPGSDVLAHLGGFIAGGVLGAILSMLHSEVRKPGVNIAAGLVSLTIVAGTWWLAMRANG